MFSTNWSNRPAEQSMERGAALVEYGMILVVVTFFAIMTLALFGNSVFDLFQNNDARMAEAMRLSATN